MKKLIPVLMILSLLLCACGKEEPNQTEIQTQPKETDAAVIETENSGEGEGVLDPTTEVRYLLVKMIVTNDQGEELWSREYSYDDTGFCTLERKFSNIDPASYTRYNSPDHLNRIGSSVFTELDGSQYTVTYTYDEFDRCVREEFLYEDGTVQCKEYTFNDQGMPLTVRDYINGELVMDYSFSYTYDGQGNQVSTDEYLFGELLYHVALEYDEQGREIGSVTSLVNAEVQSRTESQWDGLTETRYYYSGEDVEPYMVSVFTYDDNGNVVFEETRQGDTVINRAEYIYEPFEVKK